MDHHTILFPGVIIHSFFYPSRFLSADMNSRAAITYIHALLSLVDTLKVIVFGLSGSGGSSSTPSSRLARHWQPVRSPFHVKELHKEIILV